MCHLEQCFFQMNPHLLVPLSFCSGVMAVFLSADVLIQSAASEHRSKSSVDKTHHPYYWQKSRSSLCRSFKSQQSQWRGSELLAMFWTICVGATSSSHRSHARDGEGNADCSRSDFCSTWRTRTRYTECQKVRKLIIFLLPSHATGQWLDPSLSVCLSVCLLVRVNTDRQTEVKPSCISCVINVSYST